MKRISKTAAVIIFVAGAALTYFLINPSGDGKVRFFEDEGVTCFWENGEIVSRSGGEGRRSEISVDEEAAQSFIDQAAAASRCIYER